MQTFIKIFSSPVSLSIVSSSGEIKTNRLTMSYVEVGDASKELFILIHGNTSSNLFFLENMNDLSKDFHVIAPDLKGETL